MIFPLELMLKYLYQRLPKERLLNYPDDSEFDHLYIGKWFCILRRNGYADLDFDVNFSDWNPDGRYVLINDFLICLFG